jgi:hypothetical protein
MLGWTLYAAIPCGAKSMKWSIGQSSDPEVSGSDAPKTVAEAIYQQSREDIVWIRLPPNGARRSDELRAAYGVRSLPPRKRASGTDYACVQRLCRELIAREPTRLVIPP